MLGTLDVTGSDGTGLPSIFLRALAPSNHVKELFFFSQDEQVLLVIKEYLE